MASEAEINRKRLLHELAKPMPDSDVVYFLRTTRPYCNTIDTSAMRHGAEKLDGNSLQRALERLAPKEDRK